MRPRRKKLEALTGAGATRIQAAFDVPLCPTGSAKVDIAALPGRDIIDQSAAQQKRLLFDYLVGERQKGFGDSQPKRFGSRQIDNEIEFGRLLDGEIARLGPAQNLVHILSGTPE